MAKFPAVAMKFRTEMWLRDSGRWEDVTPFVHKPVTVNRGKANEGTRADATAARVRVNNTDGRFSPRNGAGPYFGQFGRNTLMRGWRPAGGRNLVVDGSGRAFAHIVGSYATASNDLDVRLWASFEPWSMQTGTTSAEVNWIAGAWNAVGLGSARDWRWGIDANGIFRIEFSNDGLTTSGLIIAGDPIPMLLEGSQKREIRFTLDADIGGGLSLATFYYRNPDSSTWIPIGTSNGITFTPVWATGAIVVGNTATLPPSQSPGMRVHGFNYRDGINGSPMIDAIFDQDTDVDVLPGGSMTDFTGNTWDMLGARVADEAPAFAGEVSSWPQTWSSGENLVISQLENYGILRRYGQGSNLVGSSLRRQLIRSNPLAYWPLEDAQNSTTGASPLAGVNPIRVTGGGVAWANNDTLNRASLALPDLTSGSSARLTGLIPPHIPTGLSVSVGWVMKMNSLPSTTQTVINLTLENGEYSRIGVLFNSANQVQVVGQYADGSISPVQLVPLTVLTGDHLGQWTAFRLQVVFGGGNSNTTFYQQVLDQDNFSEDNIVGAAVPLVTATPTAGTARQIVLGAPNSASDTSVGHLTVYGGGQGSPSNSHYSPILGVGGGAGAGWNGETAIDRFNRLLNEENLPGTAQGFTVDSETVGPQLNSSLLNLFSELAEADGGLLGESRYNLGLIYRCRAALTNQKPAITLVYKGAGPQIAEGLAPVDDDQSVRNDVTVSRNNGSSARVEQVEGPLNVSLPEDGGVGRYESSVTLNVADDRRLIHQAGWRVHLGTADEARYPVVSFSLFRNPNHLAAYTDLEIGDVIRLTNLPLFLPSRTVDLMVQGMQEEYGSLGYDVKLNCTPATPWTMPRTTGDDPFEAREVDRVDTSGSSISEPATIPGLDLTIQTSAGPAWSTDFDDYPLTLDVNGEHVTAPGPPGPRVFDDFNRVTASGWGVASSGDTWSTSGGVAADYSTNGFRGVHSIASVNVVRQTFIAPDIATDWDVQTTVTVPVAATGADFQVSLAARFQDTSNFYRLSVNLTTGGTLTLGLHRVLAGVSTTLKTRSNLRTVLVNTALNLRFRVQGDRLQGKVWYPSAGAEPQSWHIDTIDLAPLAFDGSVSLQSTALTGSTATLPVLIEWEDLTTLNPQRFESVDRSQNGVFKAHAIGADVRLAATPYLDF